MLARAVRLLAALTLMLGTHAAPGSGIAHGLAHHRDAEHRAEHHGDGHGHASAHAHADDSRGERAVTEQDHHRDHGHVTVDDGLRTRADGATLLRADVVTAPAARALLPRVGPVVPRAALARADPHTGPPPRLRAPPA